MHKKSNLQQHLLIYAFGLKKDDDNVDKRSIPLRGRRGVIRGGITEVSAIEP